jgi:hypothetical protein
VVVTLIGVPSGMGSGDPQPLPGESVEQSTIVVKPPLHV